MLDSISRRRFVGTAGLSFVAGVASAADSTKPTDKLTILGISCSPREGKTTAQAVRICLNAASEVSDRIRCELIDLANLKIPAQVAAGVPLEEGERDDFPSLIPRLEDSKVVGFVIGTPVYFGNMSALCKSFLDRCIAFRQHEFSLTNKVAGVLAVGGNRNGGQELTIQSVQTALMSHQVVLVGDGRPTAHWGGTLWNQAEDDISADELGVSTAKNLGKRMAELALKLHGG